MKKTLKLGTAMKVIDLKEQQAYCQLGKHHVSEDDIAVDDYGLVACNACYKNNPDVQKAMQRAAEKDLTNDQY